MIKNIKKKKYKKRKEAFYLLFNSFYLS